MSLFLAWLRDIQTLAYNSHPAYILLTSLFQMGTLLTYFLHITGPVIKAYNLV